MEPAAEKTKALIIELVEALQANGIFHTPIALRRRGCHWDEYEMDAINRTREAINSASQFCNIFRQ